MNSPQISAVLAVVKIAALCFSVGEGLRLTPFPVPTFSEAQFAQVSVTDSPDKTFLSQYGPLDVPAQNQKRSKRQVLQLAGSTAAEAREIVPESSPFSHHESLDVASVLLVPRTAGRAPPFLL